MSLKPTVVDDEAPILNAAKTIVEPLGRDVVTRQNYRFTRHPMGWTLNFCAVVTGIEESITLRDCLVFPESGIML